MAGDKAHELLERLGTAPYPLDPYPLYRELRQVAPVVPSTSGLWYATTYEACAVVFRSPAFGQGEGGRRLRLDPRFDRSPTLQTLAHMITYIDPPDHTRLRRLVSRAFTPRTVAELRPFVQDLVDSLLDHIIENGGGDLVAEFANQIPVRVVSQLLGVPRQDHDQFQAWSDDVALIVEPTVSEEALAKADAATLGYQCYFEELVARRAMDPGDDLLSALIMAKDEGDRLSQAELISMAVELLGAGSETTRNLIGGGIVTLLEHPALWARLKGEPAAVKKAVDEQLRFEPPIQSAVPRFALHDIEVDGVLVKEGTMVSGMIGAANHDPARFSHPDLFDLDRPDTQALSFAPGIHYCLGAAVARLEGQLSLGSLVRRFDQLSPLGGVPPMRPANPLGQMARGPAALEVELP